MLTLTLALEASFAYGISDFLGGLTSRSVAFLPVLLVSQGTALILLSIIVISRGEGPPDGAFLLYAAIAGLSETVGVAALYRGLAVGVMSIVAPMAAAAPVVPVVVGIVLGEFPTPIQNGTVYGMNFDHMPELHWALGYPFALLLMVLVSATLYVVFKQRGWM